MKKLYTGLGVVSAILILMMFTFYIIGVTNGDGLTDEQRQEYLFRDMTIEEFDKILNDTK